MQKEKMPVLFIGHGSPMNAIEENEFSSHWRQLAAHISKPKAILCISAHWQTNGVRVTSSQTPKTIHDFGGFPQALFNVNYNAPGSSMLANRIIELVKSSTVYPDENWGLDHGSWSVLLPMYPNADIPLVQLSLDKGQSNLFHYNLAKELKPLRDEGILIIGSGDIVHNLQKFSFHRKEPYDWAQRFNTKIKDLIIAGRHEEIINYKSIGQDADLSVPTDEHYLPLLYALALQDPEEEVIFFNDKVISSISMTSIFIGKYHSSHG